MPIGADNKTYRPNIVNFSRPFTAKRITRARAAILPTIFEEHSLVVEDVFLPSSIGVDIRHVTIVQETKINDKMWHIARLHKTFAKQCWAQMVVTKKKCMAQIIVNSKSTAAPTYSDIWRNIRLNCEEPMQFLFYADDIKHCVKGSHRKRILPFSDQLEHPPIPSIWPMKIGTNLRRREIEALKHAGFQLQERENPA